MIVMIKGSWYKVPEVILTDKGLTLADAAVFAHVAQVCQQGTAELSTESIAAETGYSSRTVTAAVKRLSERHYLAVELRPGKASLYKQLLLPPARSSGSSSHRRQQQPNPDIEKYKVVINDFGKDFKPSSDEEVKAG